MIRSFVLLLRLENKAQNSIVGFCADSGEGVDRETPIALELEPRRLMRIGDRPISKPGRYFARRVNS